MAEDISILIKTFERPRCLRRLLASLDRMRVSHPILVADDSARSSREAMLARFPRLDLHYHDLPFDSGISAGRNALLAAVRTPYFLLCDDDFVFDSRSDPERARRRLEARGLDILGGVFFDRTRRVGRMWRNLVRPDASRARYDVRFWEEPNPHTLKRADREGGSLWQAIEPAETELECDVVNNFFIARTEAVRRIGGWHEALKVSEHHAFFLRARQAGLTVGFDAAWGVRHRPLRSRHYRAFRERDVSATKARIYDELAGPDSE